VVGSGCNSENRPESFMYVVLEAVAMAVM
jgi:hypothetical protein